MSQTSWCAGNARTDTTSAGIQGGLLYPYDRSPAIYHCPSDVSTIQDANGNLLPQLRTRSYNMSQSVNGYPLLVDPESAAPVDTYQPCFAKSSQITNPPPSQLFVFIDENEGTLQDDQFGYPMPNDGYFGTWWDMPSNRHNQGANLSFADGHVEHWHWAVPKIDTLPPNSVGQAVQSSPQSEWPDYLRVGNAMRIKLVDGQPD
jgi:prepilin-type processing-associated H-X9-DG protein